MAYFRDLRHNDDLDDSAEPHATLKQKVMKQARSLVSPAEPLDITVPVVHSAGTQCLFTHSPIFNPLTNIFSFTRLGPQVRVQISGSLIVTFD
jgi:hypothetical protein